VIISASLLVLFVLYDHDGIGILLANLIGITFIELTWLLFNALNNVLQPSLWIRNRGPGSKVIHFFQGKLAWKTNIFRSPIFSTNIWSQKNWFPPRKVALYYKCLKIFKKKVQKRFTIQRWFVRILSPNL